MKELYEFLDKYSLRGDCTCSRCVDAPQNPRQPTGHTADVFFFKVAARNNPSAEQFRVLIHNHKQGDFASVDLFDGNEHSYMELGGWIGDQGAALTLMGLGSVMGLWDLMTPQLLGFSSTDPLGQQMAGAGYITIKAKVKNEVQ